jgi:hypothetical protein
MALSKEQAAQEKASILAAEQTLKERWCALEGHKWDLPQPNPLNADFMECTLRCNRCNITAKLLITIDKAAGK